MSLAMILIGYRSCRKITDKKKTRDRYTTIIFEYSSTFDKVAFLKTCARNLYRQPPRNKRTFTDTRYGWEDEPPTNSPECGFLKEFSWCFLGKSNVGLGVPTAAVAVFFRWLFVICSEHVHITSRLDPLPKHKLLLIFMPFSWVGFQNLDRLLIFDKKLPCPLESRGGNLLFHRQRCWW